MCDKKEAEGLPVFFASAKTTTTIPVRHPALRDALIQAPSIRGCGRSTTLPQPAARPPQVTVDAVVVQDEDSRYVLDVVPARCMRNIEDEGLVLIALGELKLEPLVLTAEEIRREPRRANANLVWSHSDVTVPIGLRMRIQRSCSTRGRCR